VLALPGAGIMPLAVGLKEPLQAAATGFRAERGCRHCARPSATAASSWLMAGYFVCGFQVVFIGVHMPSYLKDHGMAPGVATMALALIGLFNVFGTYTAGCAGRAHAQALHPGGHLRTAVAVVISLFLLAPLTP
jgi:apolipoprotein N-acyltransferase